MSVKEGAKFGTKFRIDKFRDPSGEIAKFLRNGGSVEEAIRRFGGYLGSSKFEGNVMLNEGIQALWDLICGLATVTKWDSTNARTGVGDDTTAEDPTQTGLIATVNVLYKGMDTGYPVRSAQTVDWRSTYDGTEANYAWNEFTVDNGSAALQNLNRKVSAQGTKTSGQTWVLTVSITLA